MGTDISKYRLTPSQHEILGLLAGNELTVKEMANRLERHERTMRRAIKDLYQRGLVKLRVADNGAHYWRFIL